MSKGDGATAIRLPTLLDQLSSDCLAMICQQMPFKYLQVLKQCGNPTLTAKLERGVTEIVANLKTLSHWPISVFQHPNLRSLIINPSRQDFIQSYGPVLAKEDILVPHTGHQMLERLELNLNPGFTLLHPTSSRPPLATLLPNLKSLKIKGGGQIHIDTLEKTVWPKSLTLLKLKPFSFTDDFAFSYSSLEKLPSSLETLHIESVQFARPQRPLEEKMFPSSLTSLKILSNGYQELIKVLPTSLRTIRLHTSDKSNEVIRISPLFRFPTLSSFSLTFLSTSHGATTFIADQPFPSTLTSLILPTNAYLTSETGEKANLAFALPPSLTTFQGFDSHHDSFDWSTNLPILRKLPTAFPLLTSIAKFPPLTTLNMPYAITDKDRIASLPVTLTSLSAPVFNIPAWLESIAKMTQLKTLALGWESHALPSKGFWDVVHERISQISFEIHHCESLKDVFGDWKQLTQMKLKVRHDITQPALAAELDAYSSSQPQYRYPASLENLELTMSSHAHVFSHPVQYLPKLQELSLYYISLASEDFMRADKDKEIWTKLPSSLRSLIMLALHGVPDRYLWSLPKKLRELKITVDASKGDFVWTQEHLRHLPQSLERCHLRGSRFEGPADVTLPACLTFFDVAYTIVGNRTPAMAESQRQRKLILS